MLCVVRQLVLNVDASCSSSVEGVLFSGGGWGGVGRRGFVELFLLQHPLWQTSNLLRPTEKESVSKLNLSGNAVKSDACWLILNHCFATSSLAEKVKSL